MDLFNAQTREREDINDQDALHQALLSGSHSFKSGASIPVVDPDGVEGFLPAESVVQALQSGFRVKTANQNAVEAYVDDNKGMGGAMKVFLKDTVDEAAMGLPEMIYEKTGDSLEVAKHEALKKEHSVASALGSTTGFAGSMLYGGPLFKGAAKVGEKTTALLAEKLMAKAGEELTKRSATKIARELVAKSTAKAVGHGVEGAIVSSPIAITEAMLGDHEAAAESLLAGVGIGSLFGVGGAMFGGLSKVKNTIANSEKVRETTIQGMARKAAKVLVGVPEDDIAHYIKNHERINQAPAAEAIKDMLDEGVEKLRVQVDEAKDAYNRAQAASDEGYRAAKQALSAKRAPEHIADDLMGTMDQQKIVLGEMSEQADELLEASGRTFQKTDLLKFMDQVGSAIGVKGEKGAKVLVSDTANTAVQKLYNQRQRIADGFGEAIDAVQLRGILRQVREDINYNQFAGEFNDTLNKARKTFSERISDVLKVQVPGYRELMGQMSDISENLGQMSKAFGTRERAISSLNQAVTAKGKLKQEALENFGKLVGRDFSGELSDLRLSKALIDESRVKDIGDKLTPELRRQVQAAEARLQAAVEAYHPVKRLSQVRTQNIIRQQGFKNASIEDRRALELLSQREGVVFSDLIRDRNVLDNFGKEMTNGSRRTLLGALFGSAMSFGGPLGPIIGGAAGAAADIYGGAALKSLIDNNLKTAGLLFTEQAMKRSAEKIDEIPKILKRMSTGAKIAKTASIPVLARLFGDETYKPRESAQIQPKPLPQPIMPARPRQLKRANEDIGDLVSNPERALEKLEEIISPIAQGGAPGVGAVLSANMAKSLQYLHTVMPKPPRMPSPFAPKVLWQPSDYDMTVFEQKMAVVADPFHVMDELEAGTLTKNHMEALKVCYPKLHEAMVTKIYKSVAEIEDPIPYGDRVKLSLLIEQPLDIFMQPAEMAKLQASFAVIDQPEQGAAPGGGPQLNLAQGMETQGQRLLARGG